MQAIPTIKPFIKHEGKCTYRQYKVDVDLPNLVPGRYEVSVWYGSHNTDTIEWLQRILGFEILESPVEGRTFPHSPDHGFIVPNCRVLECNSDAGDQ
jgi:lipopolysaccharide transport system ATP-binding protein